jgi:hypothetical protein
MARIDLEQLEWLEEAWGDAWEFFQSATGRYWLARFKHPRPLGLRQMGGGLPSATVVADSGWQLDKALRKERDAVTLYWERMVLRSKLMERSLAARVA